MIFPNLKLNPMLKQHLARAGVHLPPPLIKAETQLLRREIEQGITSAFDKAIEESSFARKYSAIVNLSPVSIGDLDYQTLFRRLCGPEQGLIMKSRTHEDGILWTPDSTLRGWRDHFMPHPLDLTRLPTEKGRLLTRQHVARWNHVAVLVLDESVPTLVQMIRGARHRFEYIVAGDGGVMVGFKCQANCYRWWKSACASIRTWCVDNNVKIGKISLHTLVPVSRESRGRGALLYLAA